MSNSRFQYAYRENASKLHKAVGEILRTGEAFGEHEAYQEYPVNRVNTDYPEGSHHFDWVIPDLKLVIECHGIQHYKVVDWEGGEAEKAIAAFKALKERDFAKREAAWVADWIYVEVPYSIEKDLDEAKLLQLIDESKNAATEYMTTHGEQIAREREEKRRAAVADRTAKAKVKHDEQKEKLKQIRQDYLKSDKHQELLEKARLARQENYRKRTGGK
jgi:hypothetical protein